MNIVEEFILNNPPPIYIEVIERSKRVTVKIVDKPSPGTIPFSRSVYEDVVSRYVNEGRKVNTSSRESSVYLLYLDEKVCEEKKMKTHNPHPRTGRCLYIGMTNLDPEERINNHVIGHKSCNLVKKYYSGVPIGAISGMFYCEAMHYEKTLPDLLRGQGYWVYQA